MLTIAELKTVCPSALATKPASHCSPRYSMVPSVDAIKALEAANYVMVHAMQDSVRPDKWDRHLHTRHRIVMRLKGTETMSKAQRTFGLIPEILLTNSSDGSCPFEADLGMLRQVCSNGLIVFQSQDKFSFVHKKITPALIVERAQRLTDSTKPVYERIERWSKLRLNDTAQLRFAQGALILRMGLQAKNYDPKSLLRCRRKEDEEPTVWNIFNRIQENGMKGHVLGTHRTEAGERAVKARPLNSILASTEFNKGLWQYTEDFLKKVGAA